MTQSFTGDINTNGSWATVASETGLNLAAGKKFNMQIQNIADLKIRDAVFTLKNEKFDYTTISAPLYIRTNGNVPCILTMLETVNS